MASWGSDEEKARPRTARRCLASRWTRLGDLARAGEATEVVARQDTASLGWTATMSARQARLWRAALVSTWPQYSSRWEWRGWTERRSSPLPASRSLVRDVRVSDSSWCW